MNQPSKKEILADLFNLSGPLRGAKRLVSIIVFTLLVAFIIFAQTSAFESLFRDAHLDPQLAFWLIVVFLGMVFVIILAVLTPGLVKGLRPPPVEDILVTVKVHRPGRQTDFSAGVEVRATLPGRGMLAQTTDSSGTAEFHFPGAAVGKTATFGVYYQGRTGSEKSLRLKPADNSVELEWDGGTRRPLDPREAYLCALRDACQVLPLTAIGKDPTDHADITLDQIYIDLDTTTPLPPTPAPNSPAPVSDSDSDDPDPSPSPSSLSSSSSSLRALALRHPQEGRASVVNSSSSPRPITALEAAIFPRLVLLGDPGAGKSTFVRYLCARLAAAGLGESLRHPLPPEFSAGLLPVLVTLRDLAPRLGQLDLAGLPAEQREAALLDALRDQIRAELAALNAEAAAFTADLLAKLDGGHCCLVLDGLDEVPAELRERVREAAGAVIRRWRVERIIVTCRVRSYHGPAVFSDFHAFTLAPFDENKIDQFARGWYNTQVDLKKFNQDEAERRADNFKHAAKKLAELAANPMLLTSMAIIHQRDIGLPDQRVKLYSLVVDVLARRWQRHKAGDALPSPALADFLKNDLRLRAALERLGYEAQRAGNDRASDASGDLARMKALAILEAEPYLGSLALAQEFLDYVDQRAGLLVGRGGEPGRPLAYGFPHRSLQEYLAGCYLIDQRDLFRSLYPHAGEGEGWDLAVRLGMEELYYNRRGRNTLLDLVYSLSALCAADTPRNRRAQLWSGQGAALLGEPAIQRDDGRPDGGLVYLERIRPQLIAVLSSDLPDLERCEAGAALARLGDPRPEVITVPGMRFCCVPGGPFAFQEDQRVDLPTFWLGLHPVSQAQFAEFVRDGGYTESRLWPEALEASHWSKAGFKGPDDGQPRQAPLQAPLSWGGSFALPNYPVVGISWYEALAFTRWLDERAHHEGWLPAGWQVRLPTEQEWEKAARGGLDLPDAPAVRAFVEGPDWPEPCLQRPNPLLRRLYPWGDEFDRPKANTRETGIAGPSALGCFASGAGSYGNLDLGGNVWEWQENWKDELQKEKSLRGGSWGYDSYSAYCTYCIGRAPAKRYNDAGLRCTLSPKAILPTIGSGDFALPQSGFD